jgi:hypothetical protein
MCVNSNVPDYMAEIGFAVVDSVTILGLEIEGDSGEFNRTFERIHTKVRNNIATWKRFNLSLPGRVCIAKTMLYSQVNYIGCFLVIPEQFVKRISDLICDYVCGDLNLAEKRLFLPAQMGGLGLFELDSFLAAQRCSWIQRSLDLDEKWKLTLYFNSYGNIPTIRKSLVNPHENPVLYGVARRMNGFWAASPNITKIFGGPLFSKMTLFLLVCAKKSASQKIFLTMTSLWLTRQKYFHLRYGTFI